MNLYDIAINNLRRRKARMLLLVAGVLLGVATVVALFSLTAAMNDQILREQEAAGARVLILPQSEGASFSYGGITIASDVQFDVKDVPFSLVAALEEGAGEWHVLSVSAKKVEGAEIDGRSVMVVGLDLEQELQSQPWLEVQGTVPKGDGEILLGASVAAALEKAAGDVLVLADREFRVTGVLLETGGQEDGVIMATLADVRNLSGTNALSLIEVTLRDTPSFDADVEAIRVAFPGVKVTAVKEVTGARKAVVERFEHFALVASVVMFAVAALTVATTMIGSVAERVAEIGILRAMGFRRTHVMTIILTEAAATCALGGAMGFAAGTLAARLAVPLLGQSGLVVAWNPVLGLAMILFAVAVGLGAGFVPAVRAANLDPAEALRYF